MGIEAIRSFDQVILNKNNPLVICDIDKTLLYIDALLSLHFFTDLSENNILPTDILGFLRMKKRIEDLNGNLIFLTARNIKSWYCIESDFEKIGLVSDDYEIHYTGNTITKGKYVSQYINTNKYNELIFIDNLFENHTSMKHYFPSVRCYLFKKN